jgi:hypothetical protein
LRFYSAEAKNWTLSSESGLTSRVSSQARRASIFLVSLIEPIAAICPGGLAAGRRPAVSSASPARDYGLLDPLRDGPSTRSGMVPVRPELVAGVRYFGRYRTGGGVRDSVLLSVG